MSVLVIGHTLLDCSTLGGTCIIGVLIIGCTYHESVGHWAHMLWEWWIMDIWHRSVRHWAHLILESRAIGTHLLWLMTIGHILLECYTLGAYVMRMLDIGYIYYWSIRHWAHIVWDFWILGICIYKWWVPLSAPAACGDPSAFCVVAHLSICLMLEYLRFFFTWTLVSTLLWDIIDFYYAILLLSLKNKLVISYSFPFQWYHVLSKSIKILWTILNLHYTITIYSSVKNGNLKLKTSE